MRDLAHVAAVRTPKKLYKGLDVAHSGALTAFLLQSHWRVSFWCLAWSLEQVLLFISSL